MNDNFEESNVVEELDETQSAAGEEDDGDEEIGENEQTGPDIEIDLVNLVQLAWNASVKLPPCYNQNDNSSGGIAAFAEVVRAVVESVLSHVLYSLGLIPMPLPRLIAVAQQLQQQEDERLNVTQEVSDEEEEQQGEIENEMNDEGSRRRPARNSTVRTRRKRRLTVSERKLLTFTNQTIQTLHSLIDIIVNNMQTGRNTLSSIYILLGPSIHNAKRVIRLSLSPISCLNDTLFPGNLDSALIGRLIDRVQRLTIQRLISYAAESHGQEGDLLSKGMASCSIFLAVHFVPKVRIEGEEGDRDRSNDDMQDHYKEEHGEGESEDEPLFNYSDEFSLPRPPPPIRGRVRVTKNGKKKTVFVRTNKPRPLHIEIMFAMKEDMGDEEGEEGEEGVGMMSEMDGGGHDDDDDSESVNDNQVEGVEIVEGSYWWLQGRGIKTLKVTP